jgi:hypothetical protein
MERGAFGGVAKLGISTLVDEQSSNYIVPIPRSVMQRRTVSSSAGLDVGALVNEKP